MALTPRGNTPEPEAPKPKKDRSELLDGQFHSFGEIIDKMKDETPDERELINADMMKNIPEDIRASAFEAAAKIDELVKIHDDMLKNPSDMELAKKFVDELKKVIDGDDAIARTVMSAGVSALSFIKGMMGGNK